MTPAGAMIGGQGASGGAGAIRAAGGEPAEHGHITVDGIMAVLRANGGRATATRRATVEALLAGGSHRHLRAEEVVGEVRRRLPDAAESSIYRTLGVLEDLGLVTHVHLDHGPSTFHLADPSHRHLACERCGSVVEVPSAELAPLAHRLSEAYGFVMSTEHFAIAGLCRACRAAGQCAPAG